MNFTKSGSQSAGPNGPPDKNQPSEPVMPKLRKFPLKALIPTLAINLWRLNFTIGMEKSEGRNVFMILHERLTPVISFSFWWLTEESPMIGLYLHPVTVAYFLWMHSNDPYAGRE